MAGDNAHSRYLNLLEPPALVQAFLAHPPVDFGAFLSAADTPAFRARFDLLTTAEPALQQRIARLPLFNLWRCLLRPRTCFVGTTVSEYALLPRSSSPVALVDAWLAELARAQPFLIIKDIPEDSPLLDAESNANARAVINACRAAGFVILEGQALAWLPIDFTSADDYLQRLSSARRKDIRRKLRSRDELEISVLATGATEFADATTRTEFYALFRNVYAQSEIHFDQLTPAFFDAVLQDASSGGVVFTYRRNGCMIGWNLCFVVGDKLIDKYVGFVYPDARDCNLYFISWMRNLDYACERGLKYYVAGWTDPQIKAYLGAQFTFTRHAVYPRSRVLRALLRRIAGKFESDRAWFDKQADAAP
ncbi:MAG: GNAT family N-acetyltransferase [Dokdonella sp.]